eukprot:4952326-Alexandrium_andersonii.AAC.1
MYRIRELQGAPRSSCELWEAPESLRLVRLLYALCMKAGRLLGAPRSSRILENARLPEAFEA